MERSGEEQIIPDERARSQAMFLARLLDSAFRIPGTDYRIGIDPLLGLVPGFGDLIGGGLSIYIIWLGVQAGAPLPVLLRMGINVAMDTIVGSIPFLGDLVDFGWKANSRNAILLQEYLDNPRRASASSYLFLVVAVILLVGLIFATGWVTIRLLKLMGEMIGI